MLVEPFIVLSIKSGAKNKLTILIFRSDWCTYFSLVLLSIKNSPFVYENPKFTIP